MTAEEAQLTAVGTGLGDSTRIEASIESLPRWARGAIGYGLLALLAYVPMFLTAPGKVAADTKQYLYLDPGRLLSRSWSMWDPNIGMGTVTHQNIGYLFPLGPFYWMLNAIGSPDWVAQRIWLGSLLFLAALGMLFLFRTIGLKGPGAVVGALAFMLSPYALDYAARISVILLPWAGLPWLLALTMRALRRGGWKHAALIALLVQVIGSVNATALVFVGMAPLLWVPYSVVVLREVDWRRALATVARIGLLATATSLWWMSGLWAQGSYGLNILDYTETLRAVSRTSLPNEVLRGLGYWFFYGRDKLGSWIEASIDYTQRPFYIILSYGIPFLGLLSAAWVRWRYRAYFALLVVVGVVTAVGAHPYDSPTPIGAAFKGLASTSSAAFALRSTGRATPLVVLGMTALLASGVNALWTWLRSQNRPRIALAVPVLVGVMVIVNLPALWNESFYGANLQRDEDIPQYWKDATAYLDSHNDKSRVFEMPGADFASYRWGNTVDPITPGIMDRPYVARELIPYGSAASANLLNAVDLRIQSRQLPSQAIAPVAKLMGVGDIALRNDLQFERYRVLRPGFMWSLFQPTPAGMTGPVLFGKTTASQAHLYPFRDEQALAEGPQTVPPPVAVFGVTDPTPIIGAKSRSNAVLIAGDGDGVVDASTAGLLDADPLVLYSAPFANELDRLREQAAESTLVVTDSNRRRGRRWSTVTDTVGYTEGPGAFQLGVDESDARLDVFPGAPSDAYTTTVLRGVKFVGTTSYSNPITYTPEDRPARAIDGDPYTAWRTGAFDDVTGDRIRVVLKKPITTDHLDVVQVLKFPNERFITRARLRFDDKTGLDVDFGGRSRRPEGQRISFPRRSFSTLEIEILDTNLGVVRNYSGVSPVGFGEIRLRDDGATVDVVAEEAVRMPSDLLKNVGTASLDSPLAILMTRERVIPVPPRSDPERDMTREFSLPTERSFSITGDVRLSSFAPDAATDRILGYSGPVVANSSAHLAAAPATRASAALDGNPDTAWVTPFEFVENQWISFNTHEPITINHLDLQVVADGLHSVPTSVEIRSDSGETRTVKLPPVTDLPTPGAVSAVPITFPAMTGSEMSVMIRSIRPVTTREWYCECDLVVPAAIAELGVPSLPYIVVSPTIPEVCELDLVVMDGKGVGAMVVGSTADAVALKPLQLVACDLDADPAKEPHFRSPTVDLGEGTHELRTQRGDQFGWNVDRLALGSLAGGAAWQRQYALDGTLTPSSIAAPSAVVAPQVEVLATNRWKARVRVTGVQEPFWLVLGQSQNAGWRARVADQDLGSSTIADGYGNGWLVTPTGGAASGTANSGTLEITLEWEPQNTVNRALGISTAAILLCLGVLFVAAARRRREQTVGTAVCDAELPMLASPLVARGSRPGKAGVFVTTLIAILVGGLVVAPWVGLVLGAVVLLVLLRPQRRWIISLFPPVALAACGAFIAAKQVYARYPATFEWPTFFSEIRTLGWLVVVVLAADAIVEIARNSKTTEDAPDA